MLRSPSRKARRPIAPLDVDRVFEGACIDTLMQIGKFPARGDKKIFAEGIRDAARIYVRDANEPTTVNELADEIEILWRTANGRQYDEVANLLGALSERTRNALNERGQRRTPGIVLPMPEALRDAAQQETACDTIVRLCQIGDRVKGSSWQPLFYAPDRKQHFPKRKAERDFVMHLRLAWLHATGNPPAPTARDASAGRAISPFARLVRECLRLMGAQITDSGAVELINELHRRRQHMQASQ
jgi:hypothetical protein